MTPNGHYQSISDGLFRDGIRLDDRGDTRKSVRRNETTLPEDLVRG